MSKIVGIDLGTTNSVVAVMEGGEPVVIASTRKARACSRPWSPSTPRAASAWSARSPGARPSPTRTTPSSQSNA